MQISIAHPTWTSNFAHYISGFQCHNSLVVDFQPSLRNSRYQLDSGSWVHLDLHHLPEWTLSSILRLTLHHPWHLFLVVRKTKWTTKSRLLFFHTSPTFLNCVSLRQTRTFLILLLGYLLDILSLRGKVISWSCCSAHKMNSLQGGLSTLNKYDRIPQT
jgi:hypothetical protein